MKNVVVILNPQSVLLALFALETQRTEDHNLQNIPLGDLYNQVSKEHDGNFIHLSNFNAAIEDLDTAGLATITTPNVTDAGTSGNQNAASPEQPTAQTALRTIRLTDAGRNLAENHPDWSEIEPERTMAAVGGSGGTRR